MVVRVRESREPDVPGQRLVPAHEAQVGEGRAGVGQLPGDAPDPCQPRARCRNRPKVSADQRGHGIGAAIDAYTHSGAKKRLKRQRSLKTRFWSLNGVKWSEGS